MSSSSTTTTSTAAEVKKNIENFVSEWNAKTTAPEHSRSEGFMTLYGPGIERAQRLHAQLSTDGIAMCKPLKWQWCLRVHFQHRLLVSVACLDFFGEQRTEIMVLERDPGLTIGYEEACTKAFVTHEQLLQELRRLRDLAIAKV